MIGLPSVDVIQQHPLMDDNDDSIHRQSSLPDDKSGEKSGNFTPYY